jgi:predicted MPP superfamily phosphohydrolase
VKGISLDLVIGLVFFASQWRLAVLVLRWSRSAGVKRSAVVAALAGFELIMAAGYASAFSARLPFHAAAIFGGVTYLCLFLTTCAVGMRAIVEPLLRRANRGTDLARRRVLRVAGNAAVAAPFAVLGYGAMVERTRFEVRELDIPLRGLPDDLDGLRILQISDIHLGMFLSERELARMIDAACDLRADIAFATGDFISTFGDPLEASIRQVARVKADAGMLGCLGNHERYARVENEATALAARAGIEVLRRESRRFRFGSSVLNVAGVDYQRSSRKRAYLEGAERLIEPGAFNLLLSHNPDVFPVAAAQGWNLVLAGHTHGGQVTVEILDQSISPANFLTPYVRGLYRIGAAAEYVTRGLGTVGIPARLGAPPEISLLHLRKS